jgi:predicted nucleotidyltransferase
MGLFNDFRNVSRDGWRFTYSGKELEAHALIKYKEYTRKERESRQKMAAMLTDENIRANDPKIEELKNDIEKFGSEREKCAVWNHEFKRRHEENFTLSLGDVTYFDIVVFPKDDE